MDARRWKERFFGSTRGRVVALLRGTPRTVNELADALALTDNAVRAHLAALERDGLVAQTGVRRGIGKPAHVFTLTAEAEGLFPKAYGLVLRALVAALRARMPAAEVEALVADVGRALAAGAPRAGGGAEARAAAAVELLAGIGGVADAEVAEGVVTIRGRGCPLAEAVEGGPEVCRIAAALLSEVVGVPVSECCDRSGGPPSCRFRFAG